MNQYEGLNFTENWNKKLDCQFLTTFRLHNPKKYYKGAKKSIYFKNKVHLKNVEIYEVITLRLDQMKTWMMMLDTGYKPEAFNELVRTMYKFIVKDFKTQLFDFIMLETIEKP